MSYPIAAVILIYYPDFFHHNMWKECRAFIFRVKLSRLLGAAQLHSIISQKTWIWIFTYVEKDWKSGKPWGPKFIR